MRSEYVLIGIKNLLDRRLRSSLTLIGIIIGIAAIISLISIGNGLNNAIVAQFEKMGSNILFVMPAGGLLSSGSGNSLSATDVDVLERMPDFEFVTPWFSESATVSFGTEQKNLIISGFPNDDAEARFSSMDLTVYDGRYYTDNEENVVMLGYHAALDGFSREIKINNNIEINNTKFRVVGIFDEVGNSDDDNRIYMPLDRARELFAKPNKVSMIYLTTKKGVDLEALAAKVTRNLERKRGDSNFEVVTPEQILSQLGTITLIVQIVVVGIGAISLLVGAIGIMNSMYTSVLERKKEIGIMKAIGARNSDILFIFLIESGLLGLVGGVLGALIGVIIAKLVGAAAQAVGFTLLLIKIDPYLVLFGIAFALVIGILSGTLPARGAVRLKPVETLRA